MLLILRKIGIIILTLGINLYTYSGHKSVYCFIFK